MTPLREWIRFLLLVVLLPASSASASAPIPGGILDSTGRTAYLASSTGIDSVGLARGDLLWSTAEAQQPLLVAADRLYALALTDRNLLHVRGFDLINKGKKIYQSDKIELPGWVVTAEATDRSFRCTWRREKNILHLNWQAAAWSDLGPRKQAAGEVQVDLESGEVRKIRIGRLHLAPSPSTLPQLEMLFVRWQRSIAGQLHAVALEELPGSSMEDRKKRLMLRTWDEKTGKESSARELLRGKQPIIMPGLDGIHLWVREASTSPDEPDSREARNRRHWAVYSALDGHLIARVPWLAGTQEASLIGDRVYYLTAAPLRGADPVPTRRISVLHAIDVESGKTLWGGRPLASKLLR